MTPVMVQNDHHVETRNESVAMVPTTTLAFLTTILTVEAEEVPEHGTEQTTTLRIETQNARREE